MLETDAAARCKAFSVDAETKRALKAFAKSESGGNLSALVTDLAEDSRRRLAASAYLTTSRVSSRISTGLQGTRGDRSTMS